MIRKIIEINEEKCTVCSTHLMKLDRVRTAVQVFPVLVNGHVRLSLSQSMHRILTEQSC